MAWKGALSLVLLRKVTKLSQYRLKKSQYVNYKQADISMVWLSHFISILVSNDCVNFARLVAKQDLTKAKSSHLPTTGLSLLPLVNEGTSLGNALRSFHSHMVLWKTFPYFSEHYLGWGSLAGRWVWGIMDMCTCLPGSLHCWPETVTILLIGYIPIQNKKFKTESTFFWRCGDWNSCQIINHIIKLSPFFGVPLQYWNTVFY